MSHKHHRNVRWTTRTVYFYSAQKQLRFAALWSSFAPPFSGPFRLGGIRNVYASPVGAANRLYITDRQGTTLVMSHADVPEILAVNRLDDSFSASVAVVGGELFLRGERSLYCIAEQ